MTKIYIPRGYGSTNCRGVLASLEIHNAEWPLNTRQPSGGEKSFREKGQKRRVTRTGCRDKHERGGREQKLTGVSLNPFESLNPHVSHFGTSGSVGDLLLDRAAHVLLVIQDPEGLSFQVFTP
jgi:hypothetical protein